MALPVGAQILMHDTALIPRSQHLADKHWVVWKYLLVNGQEVDICVLHGQQEDEGIAMVTNARSSATAMDKRAIDTKRHEIGKT